MTMETFLRALGKGLLAGSLTGFAIVVVGGILGGIYGAGYAFLLCPLVSAPVTLLAFLVEAMGPRGSEKG